MKKGLFNATFEESKYVVNDQYIDKALEGTKKKVMRKRLIGVFLFNGLIVLISLTFRFLDNLESEVGFQTPIDLSYFNNVWYGLVVIITIYYIYLYALSLKKMILNDYFTEKIFSFIFVLFFIQLYPLFLFGAVHIIGLPILYLVCTLYSILFISNQVLQTRDLMRNQLYKGKIKENKMMKWMGKFVQFADKYGGIIVLIILIYRLFFQENGTIETIINTVLLVITPMLIPIIGTLFLKGMFRSAVLPGYYLKKYYDEYRIEYGFTEEEWNKGMDFE